MQTFTPKLSQFLRRAALLLPLLCLSWLAQAQNIYFNSGSLSYLTTGAADNRQVQFRVQESFTINSEFRNPITVGGPFSTGATIDFGDGTAPEPVTLTVLSKGSSGGAFNNSSLTGEYTPTHTYATAGAYTATVRGPSYDRGYVFSTLVGAGAANDSPVPTPVPFVVLDQTRGTATYQVPASDPNGDALTYSLATDAEIGARSFTNPPGLSINPRTGLLNFNSVVNANLVTVYTVVVKVSDGLTSTLLYQRIDLVGVPNTAPVFVAPTPANGQIIRAQTGQPVTFTVRATDADAGDVVTLRASGLPAGAVLTPALPASGNPAQTTFTFTPTEAQTGYFTAYTLTFTAQDSQGTQTTTSVVLETYRTLAPAFYNVPSATINGQLYSNSPNSGQVFTVAPGQTVRFVVGASDDTDPDERVSLRALDLPPGATFTALPPATANGAKGAFSFAPTAASVGRYAVTFQAEDRQGLRTDLYVVIQVVGAETPPPVCDPAANRPVANADRFTATCGPLTITAGQLLSNDTDPLGRLLYVSTVGSPTNGTLVQNGGTYTFTPTPGFTGTASFTYQVLVSGAGLSYPNVASSATGHYYEFFNSPVTSPGICWGEARRQAALHSYNGLQGYLATITSADEAALLAGSYSTKDNSKRYWFGASDDAVEGEWRWKTGPEAGQLFWRGGPEGMAAGFSNWAPGEPNDYKNQYRPAGEDYGQLYGSSGLWNDVDECSTGASVFGYVVEYGGLEACTPQLYATGTVTIEVNGATAPAPVANPDFYTYSRGPKQQLFLTAADLLRNDTDPLGRPLQVRDISTPSVGQFFVFQTGPTGEFTYNYSPPPGFVGQATFTYLLQMAGPVLALPATGHYYEYVSAPGICWADAQKAAAARSYQGMGGYLATITSAAETDFLKRFGGRNWFGASDEAVEGEWRWKTGPEAGQLFWRGGPDGTALSYARWSPGQPDNFTNQFRPAGEDYGMVYGGSGLWNDLANCGDGGPVDGYLVEYGGLEACTPVLYSIGTVTVEVPFSPFFTVVGASTVVQADGKSAAPATLEALPNPSDGQFRLRVTATTDGPAQLDLYDLQGRRVKAVFTGSLRAGEVRELSVEASELAAGIYLVRLQSGQQVQNLRVAIQK